jgi:thioredoxin reductase (NADPH)
VAEHDLRAVAFPTLDETQIEKLGRCAGASLKKYRDGQALFKVGERDFKFLKSGEVEILDESGDTPKIVTVHRPGEFTGEVAQLTGSPALVSAIARGDSEVYEVAAKAVRQILNTCPDLADIILQAFIARRQLLRESGDFTGLRVIGSRYSQDTFRIRDFLSRNRVLFTWLDLETDPQVGQLLNRFGVTEAETPVVAFARTLLLRNPSNRELAEEIGIRQPLEQTMYDLVVVGAGPAGLGAAVYAASDGLNTAVLERTAPGGQASRSMLIENYLGFPTGITGSELADRAVLQANKFGARLPVASQVAGLKFENAYSILELDSGETVTAKCLLIATGADYRRLNIDGCDRFEGCGVYYAATPNEAQLCQGSDVMVVGAGNSAGQAAVFLAGRTRKVFLLAAVTICTRACPDIWRSGSRRPPISRCSATRRVRRMSGDRYLHAVEIVNNKTGEVQTLETPALFSFIGAVPRTDWLPKEIDTDSWGFIRTGPALTQSLWTPRRPPFLLETSRPGVFAAGDVRSDSVKRVASAVGEGAMAVQFVEEYLKEM